MSKIKDLSGDVFGRLTAVSPTKERRSESVVWSCSCICGRKVKVSSSSLLRGDTKSCGCIRRELLSSGRIRRTHGQRRTSLYWVWSTMKGRCMNPKNHKFPRYGGRGITICEAWMKFEQFSKDMTEGYARGLQIDRIDNNKGYSKENCHWVTSKVNNNNRYY